MISAMAGLNNPRAPRIIAGNVKTFQPNDITHIQKNHEIPRARAKNFQGFAFEILTLILVSLVLSFIILLKAGIGISYNGRRTYEVPSQRRGIWAK